MTLYFYLVAAFIIGQQARSAGVAAIAFIFYHCEFYRALFGTGWVSEIEYDVYYSLAYVLFAILGWMVSWMLNVESVFNSPQLEDIMRPRVGKKAVSDACAGKEPCDQSPCIEGSEGAEKVGSGMLLKATLYRWVMGILVCCMFIATTLPFELFPTDLIWLGWVLSFILLLVAHVIFYFIWAFRFPPALGRKPWKQVAAPYRAGVGTVLRDTDADLTLDVTLYMMIFFVVTSVVFCVVFITTSTVWWQFYTALIIFGVFFIIFFLGRFTWLHIPAKKYRGKNNTGCKPCKTASQRK